MLGKRNIPPEDLARHLELTRTVLSETLAGDTGALAAEYISAGLAQLESFPADLPTCLPEDAPHAGLAAQYLGALLKGERHVASKLLLDAAAAGTPVRELYLHAPDLWKRVGADGSASNAQDAIALAGSLVT